MPRKAKQRKTPPPREPGSCLELRPLTPRLIGDLGKVLRGGWGSSCWCMQPRLTDAAMKDLSGPGSANERRRAAMTRLSRRRCAPGLLAFEGDEPVGWVALAPRHELSRVERSRATPRIDDMDVWVIPCVTVAAGSRGRGIAATLIEAAVGYAFEKGAPAVEAYPRAGTLRTKDDNAYFGTETLFRRAGFKVIAKPQPNRPKNWIARVTMRIGNPGLNDPNDR